ncbi:thioredoxin-like protein [Jimgerdemannia flammicorona]|uniref:Thioredoxin-like protein n=1 Tax=Jimgerdemannia flammicorona TaxID=994334 RepID=A0A433QVJ4_9FUNG|nr:thioredoxin-like protein [Jimgerdemannia flammicorona]
MTGTDPIKLYTARVCPYAQRANIALKEAGVEYEAIEIDLQNKPDWYKNINPETKVPSINIRGKNIAESLVIIELVADLYPGSGLLPADPIKRAEIRFFIDYYSKISSLSYKVLGALNDKQAVKAIYDDILKGFKRPHRDLPTPRSTSSS